MFEGQQAMSDDFGNASTGNQETIHCSYYAYGFGADMFDWIWDDI